jgi:hypothetical protein
MRAEDEVLAVSAAWDRALLTNDARRIEGFMTDDWVYVGPDGTSTRSEIVGWIAAGRLVHDAMTIRGTPRVLSCGDTVILTAQGQLRPLGRRPVHRRRVDQRGVRAPRRQLAVRVQPEDTRVVVNPVDRGLPFTASRLRARRPRRSAPARCPG